jgi:predicted nucleotidyltransferase
MNGESDAPVAIWVDRAQIRSDLDEEFERILALLAAHPDVEQVWRFGSTVDGDVHATSDLDVLVVQRTTLGPVERAVALRAELAPSTALDLFVVTPEELAEGSRFLDHVRATGRRVR